MEPSRLLQETMYNPNMIISVLHRNKQLFIYMYIYIYIYILNGLISIPNSNKNWQKNVNTS